MIVKFKVQGCDDVKELSVPCGETVGGFIKRAQLAGLVPPVGICNVVLCDQSGELFSGDCPISFCECQVVCVLWDECRLSTRDGKLAEQGNAETRNGSGVCLSTGLGASVDPVYLAHRLKIAADQGVADAQSAYGHCLTVGSGVSADPVSAARYYKLAADQGLATAQYAYGLCLTEGSGVSVDPISAARYYKLAAGQGMANAQCAYGHCLRTGSGVSVDLVSAARYYQLAADQGLADAQHNYGVFLTMGSGVSVDPVSAARYYKLAADQGLATAQYAYGLCLTKGSGVSVDPVSAARYYKLAADQGLAVAQCAYGHCLAAGSGVSVDPVSAVRYYKLAADQGLAVAQCAYGHCLTVGSGVSVDPVSAACYYKRAADQGLADAQHYYGICLMTGSGVSVDPVSAALYVKLSAEQGFTKAQQVYGVMCYFGHGRHSDDREAALWFRRAADQSDLTASWCYGICLYMGKGVDYDKEEARHRFQFAAEHGDPEGQFCYGLLMFEENNCHLEMNSLGWEYLLKSAAGGCVEAAVIVGLQNFANTNSFEHQCFKYALEMRDFCALYNYGLSMFAQNSSSKEDLDQIVDCFRVVAEQNDDGSEYSYEKFLEKGIGVDSVDRWRIVLIECGWGLPESEFIYGKHLYAVGKIDEALCYFKRAAESRHAEAMFAYCAIHVKDFGSRVSAPHIKDYFEQAAKDGILEAQYNYGMGLLSESTDIQDLRHGVEVLSWAAKEILLRRQCKSVQINCGHQLLTFLYSPLPNLLTKRATDNYIWDHLAENLAKLGRMSCSEIFHPVIPTMVPQAIPSLSQIEN